MKFDNHFKESEVLDILVGLIGIKSQNPINNEEEVALYVQKVLQDNGINAELSYAVPGRPSVYARLKGSKPGKTMLYNGHLDTVPAGEGWDVGPFSGAIKDGKVYGRGSSDMKSGVAAMMHSAIVLNRMGNPFAGELILFFNCDEEIANAGMKKFLTEDVTADFAVIGEPTDIDICIGHKGVGRYLLTTMGTEGHTSYVKNPDNSIYKMAKLVTALEELSFKVKEKEDPFMGPGSLTVSVISGGKAANIVPGLCQIHIDRRVLPGETYEYVIGQIKECADKVAQQYNFDYKLESYNFMPATVIDENHELVRSLNKSIANATGKERKLKLFEATCEAPFFSIDKGIPTVIFGPGSLSKAHVINEYVETAEVIDAARTYIDLAMTLL